MSDGKSAEVVGSEGFVGSPLVVGFRTSPTRVTMQVEVSAFRISPRALKISLSNNSGLGKALERYTQELAVQATPTAECNRLHEVEQRLARWLLMTQDRVGASFELTQEFLAYMLGTRRATVTVTAGILKPRSMPLPRRIYSPGPFVPEAKNWEQVEEQTGNRTSGNRVEHQLTTTA